MNRFELSEMISLAERLTAAGAPAAVSTLFSVHGSSYRPLGSLMVSGPGPIMAGGVSGGCLEEYVARQAFRLTDDQPAALFCFSSESDDEPEDSKPVLGCGGSVQILVERCTRAHLQFLYELRHAFERDSASTFVTIVESDSVGLRIVRPLEKPLQINRDTRLGRLQSQALAEAVCRHATIGRSSAALVHFVPPLHRLVIFGAGNDVVPLADLARSLGWHVTVVDRRARLATRARFPNVDQILADLWDAAAGQITFTPHTAVVLMTHSLSDDIEILPQLADRPLAYLGALGPGSRRRRLLEQVSSCAPLEQSPYTLLHGPIGLDLGDRSPAGIAVSIMAEILAEMNRRPASPLSFPNSPASNRLPNHAVVDAG